MERLSRYCHRGLSSGGSRRFSRRDSHGGHRRPAGERVLAQGLGLQGARAALRPQPASWIHGRRSRARPCPRRSLRRVPQAWPYSPRKSPVAKAAPSAAEPRASAAGRESRGTGWVIVRAGGGGVQVTCAGATGTRGPSRLRLVQALPAEPRPRLPSRGHTVLLQALLERVGRRLVAELGTAPCGD